MESRKRFIQCGHIGKKDKDIQHTPSSKSIFQVLKWDSRLNSWPRTYHLFCPDQSVVPATHAVAWTLLSSCKVVCQVVRTARNVLLGSQVTTLSRAFAFPENKIPGETPIFRLHCFSSLLDSGTQMCPFNIVFFLPGLSHGDLGSS